MLRLILPYCALLNILSVTRCQVILKECVSPPLECPNENITFWLYNKNNENPYQLHAMQPENINAAPWISGQPIKILIHGYTGHRDYSPNTEIRPVYLNKTSYNVISVDYNPIAREPCYIQAAHNTELVGMCTAQLIDRLVQVHDIPLFLFHIIGFSLGGQVAGLSSNFLNSGKLERITALDPAMPLFVTNDDKKKVDASDAKFVDCLHTNALQKGKLETSGKVDFFANGGLIQPGCEPTKEQTKSSCDHARAPAYYAESIDTDVGFYATKCYSWVTYMVRLCGLTDSDQEEEFGERVSKTASGIYFFNTNDKSPFAMGHNKKSQ